MLNWIKKYVPQFVINAYRRRVIRRQRREFGSMSLQRAFAHIYEEQLWGGTTPGIPASGTGSTQQFAALYAERIAALIDEFEITQIVDLGCGDFQVARRVLDCTDVSYHGVDIVPEVVRRNAVEFGGGRIQFSCLDITKDPLPEGQLCLVRQVFQHLSNREIQDALSNIRKTYPLAVISEHIPTPPYLKMPNADKPHGPDTRLVDGSGVILSAAPFNVPLERELCVSPVTGPASDPREVIVSWLIRGAR